MMNPVIGAIFRRDMRRWFGGPAGYVFIALFVLGATTATFWPDPFFQRNLANLDTLNEWFPLLLLFFIPAISMSVWAGERGQGTDELLFTLPAKDSHIVAGKFAAAVGIYTAALLFTAPIVFFLAYLGDPDWGLVVCNYFGLWLLGTLFLSVGMIGSQLSDSLTVAFILGALFCGLLMIGETIMEYLSAMRGAQWQGLGPIALFQEMGRGILSLATVLLFTALTVAFCYCNLVLVSRRHWVRGRLEGLHLSIRLAALIVIAGALTGIGANAGARADLTVEQVHSLSDETERLIKEIPKDQVVHLQAYVSPDVPADFVQTRRTLLDLMRQYDAIGGDRISIRVIDTERFTDEAREAEQLFGIRHQTRVTEEQGRNRAVDVYMGLAVTCGVEEVIVPFLDRGLSVEYELTRSIRVVSSTERRKVGILATDLDVFGGFDFQRGSQSADWEIVGELKLQYDVQKVAADQAYPTDLDVLIAMMPSTLNQANLDRFGAYVKAGNPTLIIDDPVPWAAPGMGPEDPKGGPRNPFMSQGQPPPEPKGDIYSLMMDLNVRWPTRDVVWDTFNPHPQFSYDDKEIAFLASESSFNQDEAITSGLREVVTIFGGHMEPAGKPSPSVIPLLRSSDVSGVIPTSQLFSTNFLGMKQPNPSRRYVRGAGGKIMASRISGGEGATQVNAVFIADLDMISSQFFQIRRQGMESMDFDNVTFVLNCVDELAGDERFVELRKRRPIHRTLTLIENEEATYNKTWIDEKDKAESRAETQLAEAQQRLDDRVRQIERRTDLDDRSKDIQIETVRSVEQRRLSVQKSEIEDEKAQAIEDAKRQRLTEETSIRVAYRVAALVSPLPAILLGLFILMSRAARERESSDQKRIAGGES